MASDVLVKYSIKGSLATEKENSVVGLLNQYTLWRLFTDTKVNRKTDEKSFTFEVWLNSLNQMHNLFEQLKLQVVNESEFINWHECTHDEEVPQPCMIVEEYRGD